MNDKEFAALSDAASELGTADAYLSSLSTRIPSAKKELEARIKEYVAKKIKYPVNEKLLAQIKKLEVTVKGGRKGVDDIIKFNSDKKKMAALPLADAKKQMQALFKRVEPAYNEATTLIAIYDSISPKPSFVLVKAVIINCTPMLASLNKYKIALGRAK